tara:strand:- start:108 stop:590 length:483 start_codon:yes stop_codon:yes gene_type:complete
VKKKLKQNIDIMVNGVSQNLLVDTGWTLLETLRDGLGLTGTKEGCSNGNCGACTVIMADKTVCSCLVFAVEANGLEITTVEGLDNKGVLSSVQKAFISANGLQCGFCTPGFLVSTTFLLRKIPNPTDEEIRLNLAGNLCRCTGYDKIVDAVKLAASSDSP